MFREILIRLERLDAPVRDEQAKVIRDLQSKCEVIKSGHYALQDGDRELIAEALKCVLYFLEFQLSEPPEKMLEPELLQKILDFINGRIEKDEAANQLLELWLKQNWPQWDIDAEDAPKEFAGTDTCPQCQNQYLVVEQVDKPYCFWCRDEVPVEYSDTCYEVKVVGGVCCPN